MSTAIYPNYNWLSDLPDHIAVAIKSKQYKKTFKSGEFIHRQAEPVSAVFQIISGQAEICYFNSRGEQFTVSLVKNGDTCGEISIITELDATYGCIARTNCEANVLPRKDFHQLLKDYPKINEKITIKISILLRLFMHRSTMASRSLVRDRLIWLLLWNKDYYGKQTSENKFVLEGFRLIDLSRMLGTAQQTLSREFQYLVSEKIAKQEGSNIIILDVEKLQDAAVDKGLYLDEGSNFSEEPL